MQHNRSHYLIIAAAGFLSACGSAQRHPAEPGPLVTGVQTEIVRLESAPQLYQAADSFRSSSTASLLAQVPGTVREIRVNAGDHVNRGQLVAVLDDRSARAQMQGADAGVKEAIPAEVEG